MGPDFEHTFDNHEIVSEVRGANGFASWLLKRVQDGKRSGVFWCRVTVSEGHLTVIGDFNPVVFSAYSLAAPPETVVAWMGGQNFLSGYVMQKARIGTGREAAITIEVEAAREDLRAMIACNNEQIAGYEDVTLNDPEECADDIRCLQEENEALQAGLEAAYENYSAQPYACADVLAMVEAIRDHENEVEGEVYQDIGERPAQRVALAHRALQRLHAILTARQA